MAYLTISARYTIKDKPKNQPGYRGCSMKYGSTGAQPMHLMIMGLIHDVVEHYAQFSDIDLLNQELQTVTGLLGNWTIEPCDQSEPEPKQSEAI